MRKLIPILILCLLAMTSCKKNKQEVLPPPAPNPTVEVVDTLSNDTMPTQYVRMEPDGENVPYADLRAKMTQAEFHELHGAELERMLIRPIYSEYFDNDQNDSLLMPMLTQGQKSLFTFRKLDEGLTEGTVEPFFKLNGGDEVKSLQNIHKIIGNEGELYGDLKQIASNRKGSPKSTERIQQMKDYEKRSRNDYIKNHDLYYKKLEEYIRKNPEEFVIFEERDSTSKDSY